MASGTAAISNNPFGFRLDMKSGVPVFLHMIAAQSCASLYYQRSTRA